MHQVVQHLQTVLRTVHCHVGVIPIGLFHTAQNSACRGKQACFAAFFLHRCLPHGDVLLLQPVGQLIKGEDGIDLLALLCLALFGNTGSDEYRFSTGEPALDIDAVRLHGRHDRRQVPQQRRIVPADQQIDRRTAGGNDDVPIALRCHAVIFPFNNRGAQRSLLSIGKAQLLQRFPQLLYSAAGIISKERGRQTGDHRRTALQHHPHLIHLADDLLGVLRTNHKALSAHDAFILNDICLIARKADRLDRTVADTFIAVFTVGFFQCQTFHTLCSSLLRRFIACSVPSAPFLQKMPVFPPA